VVIVVEGAAADVAAFEHQLPDALPDDAVIESLRSESVQPLGDTAFVIVTDTVAGGLAAPIPVDRATCEACRDEVRDAENRRYRYPLTSCTLCGPRYSVIRRMPYERKDTTMVEFPLCQRCQREYDLPDDRRFHAQTNACPKCGPRVWGIRAGDDVEWQGDGAIQEAVETLCGGGIVALKGVGGYQLLADATNAEAAARLRRRKGRAAKPLAVLVRSLAETHKIAHIDDDEKTALVSPAGPIVLLRAKQPSTLCDEVHPDLAWVGVMLPTTPLHALLVDGCARPLVCTSGNHDGEPLVHTVADAQTRLVDICDVWLHHDRAIEHPIDDSVVRVIAGRAVTIRLARGLAPLKLDLHLTRPTLALGGHLKCAAAWSNGHQSVLGPHVGDMDALATRQRLLDEIDAWQRVFGFQPESVLHDAHPDYFTTRWAEESPVPTRSIQHHHAHVVAGMLENGWLDRTVLGVSWDGTGYGPDGTVWGGEFLICDVGTYRRVARLRPFALPGGERAVREPWRSAVSAAVDTIGDDRAASLRFENVTAPDVTAIVRLCKNEPFGVFTTSAGRLFDAAASLILGVTEVDFEGQAAMMLESIADRSATGTYSMRLMRAEINELDWRPVFDELITDRQHGVAAATMAMRFHRGLAQSIVRVCRRWSRLPIVLAGGVFQNKLLTELVAEMLYDDVQPLGLPGVIPPNDGGLAAGQLATEYALEATCAQPATPASD
jgi:hydrogenase maturation protein HypF